MLLDQPHHDGSIRYVAEQHPSLGDRVPVRVWVPHAPDGSPGADRVALRAVVDGEPRLSAARQDGTDEAGTWWQAEVLAANPVTSYRFLVTGRQSGYGWLNGTGLHHRDVTDAADFRLVTHPAPPDWVLDQVVYQVFPDRFARRGRPVEPPSWAVPAAWDDPVIHRGPDVPRQFYGGDLDGVTQHLEHLTDLGATLLYLTPVFESRSNHRYDAVSFDRVDPLLGGDEALTRLLDAAHARGLRVVGDLTTNHTGSEHEWFRAAVADPASSEAGFYRFHDHPGGYDSWLGVPSLPRLDHSSVTLRERLYEGPDSVVARWLKAGLDGWRIDVANMTGRLGGQDLAHEVARAIRRTVAQTASDAWVLAEHGHDASADLTGDGWHGTMDYSGFTRPIWEWLTHDGTPASLGGGHPHGLTFLGLPVTVPSLPGSAVVAAMREFHAAAPWRSIAASTTLLDSHDTPRFRTVVGGGTDGLIDLAGEGRDRHLVGLALQLTLPGVPSLFMGDELGLTGVDGEHSRTPFPWARPTTWDGATLAAYRSWIAVRRGQIALRRGGLRWVHAGRDSITFLREHPEQRLLVHVVRAEHPPVELPLRALGVSRVEQVVTLAGAPVEAGETGAAQSLRLPATGPGGHVYLLDDGA